MSPSSSHPAAPVPAPERLRGGLTPTKIVFLVIAAASPLAALVGTLPLAFAFGADAATPLMYVCAGGVLFLFSIGYAAMSRHVTSAGGLYTYIAKGLGRRAGIVAAMIAVVSYNAFSVMLVATFAYYCHLVLAEAGLDIPWQAFAAGAIIVTGLLGVRRIDLSARVLALLIVGELGILLAIAAVFVGKHGSGAFPAAGFRLEGLEGAALAVGLMYAFTSFLGFEAAALYGEESADPKRTVPVATYASIAVVGIFYGLVSWVTVGATGPDQVASAARQDLGNFFFDLTTSEVGKGVSDILALLLLTSLFATLLACHNSTNRVVFALGREGVLPRSLGVVSRGRGAPTRASLAQTGINAVVIGLFALTGHDPFVNLSVSMTGLGTLGLVLLQGTTALSVVAFFRTRADRHWWRTGLAPSLGAVGLFAAAVLIIVNYPRLTGVEDSLANQLPLVFVLVAVGGLVHAVWLRRHRPQVWARIGRGLDELTSDPAPTTDPDEAPVPPATDGGTP